MQKSHNSKFVPLDVCNLKKYLANQVAKTDFLNISEALVK
jgi:hypothetical protein